MLISTISKVILGIAVVIFILVLPFAASMAVNEYRLWGFMRQLDSVAQFLPKHAKIIATGSQVFVSGNDEVCTYRAINVYSFYARAEEMEEIKSKIERLEFKSVKKSSYDDTSEVYVKSIDFLLIVVLVDGPYGPGLDIRCW